MYNCYADELATFTPTDQKMYDEMGARMANEGYSAPGSVREAAIAATALK